MEFGLWVEPEMVNLDSDLARAHPDWILATGGRTPLPSRHQQVLDLAHPDAYAYILERLDALLAEYPIGYLKWDHNRDLVDAGRRDGRARGARADPRRLPAARRAARAATPGVEIESCSSGGAPRRPGDPGAHRPGVGQRLPSTPWSASRSSAGPAS